MEAEEDNDIAFPKSQPKNARVILPILASSR
jgi:hypothetical protein